MAKASDRTTFGMGRAPGKNKHRKKPSKPIMSSVERQAEAREAQEIAETQARLKREFLEREAKRRAA